MDPLIGSSIIAGGTSLIQGLANWGSQHANLSWQKRMQKKAWQREDTAVQRRVKDLKAAGLSPVLAAGQGASSSGPIQTKAPELEGVSEAAMNAMALMKMKADIEKTNAETQYINKIKSEAGRLGNQFLAETMDVRKKKAFADWQVSVGQHSLAAQRINEIIQKMEAFEHDFKKIKSVDGFSNPAYYGAHAKDLLQLLDQIKPILNSIGGNR